MLFCVSTHVVRVCLCWCVLKCTFAYVLVCTRRPRDKKLALRECPSFIRDRIFCGPEASSGWPGWMTTELQASPVFTPNLFIDGMTGECHHTWIFCFACMSIYVWVHVCTCVWGSEVEVKWLPRLLSTLFKTESLNWTATSLFWPA